MELEPGLPRSTCTLHGESNGGNELVKATGTSPKEWFCDL